MKRRHFLKISGLAIAATAMPITACKVVKKSAGVKLSKVARQSLAAKVAESLDIEMLFCSQLGYLLCKVPLTPKLFYPAKDGRARLRRPISAEVLRTGLIDHVTIKRLSGGEVLTRAACTCMGGGGEVEMASLHVGAGDELSISDLSFCFEPEK